MDKQLLIQFFVPVITIAVSYAMAKSSQRQSAKAAKEANVVTLATSKSDAETEAFTRAKEFYTDVIERQDADLIESRAEVGIVKEKCEKLEDEVEDLREQNDLLRKMIIELEKQLPNHQ